MKRNLSELANNTFDLCVVGGGIYGAWVAWEATLRGLSVALVDKGDFGHATSSNSQKVIHGGLRYLQSADLPRMMESIRERTVWMRIAPHLVHPLPFVVPWSRDSAISREFYRLGLKLYDLLSYSHRNRLADPQKLIPASAVVSRDECRELLSGVDTQDVTGAVMFWDTQMHNSERLLLSLVISAAGDGATVANYAEVTDFIVRGDRVTGVKVRDVLTGDTFDINASIVVNTVGPWVNQILSRLNGHGGYPQVAYCKAMNLVVKGSFAGPAFALQSRKFPRLLFATPWRDSTIIGTAQLPADGNVDDLTVQEHEIQDFVAEINSARPGLPLRAEDVVFCHKGLVPARTTSTLHEDIQLAPRCRIIDHRQDAGLDGLLSVVGVKFTTARSVAEKVVDLVFQKAGRQPAKSRSRETPVYGGAIERFEEFLAGAVAQSPYGLPPGVMHHLAHNYGNAYPKLLQGAADWPEGLMQVQGSPEVIKAEVIYGVREEMAQKLADIVLRRTDLGSAGYPGAACLADCASIMAAELGWGHSRTRQELDEVQAVFKSRVVYA